MTNSTCHDYQKSGYLRFSNILLKMRPRRTMRQHPVRVGIAMYIHPRPWICSPDVMKIRQQAAAGGCTTPMSVMRPMAIEGEMATETHCGGKDLLVREV